MNRKHNHTKVKATPKRAPTRCVRCRSLAITARFGRWSCRDCHSGGRY